MNTKTITDRAERKTAKRKSRKEAPPKAKRSSDIPRGSLKKRVTHGAKGQTKR